jgi:hypothetical protein
MRDDPECAWGAEWGVDVDAEAERGLGEERPGR